MTLLFTLALIYFGARVLMRNTRHQLSRAAIVVIGLVLGVNVVQQLFSACPGVAS